MKRTILILLIALLSAAPLLAQYSPCYEAAFAEGKRLFNAGKYSQAKKFFNEAKDCPDPDDADAKTWIDKCNNKIAEKNKSRKEQMEKKKLEDNAAKTAGMKIHSLEFGNVLKDGANVDEHGSVLYASELYYLKPWISYDGLGEQSEGITFYCRIINPDGTISSGSNSPSGYTYSCSCYVWKWKNTNCTLTGYGNDSGRSYTPGTYGFELWCENLLIYKTTFEVKPDSEKLSYDKLPESNTIRNNAMNRLEIGNEYYNKQEYALAMKWFRKAADLGLSGAQYKIGYMYQYGESVEIDYSEAMKWYHKAADQNNTFAQSNLGLMYENGLGIPIDLVEAVKWYRLSAEDGNREGQYNLGRMYEKGQGVDKDSEKAKYWYLKAAAQGHQSAKEHLKAHN